MKRVILALTYFVMILITLGGCSTSTQRSNVADYGNWNNTTAQLLKDSFTNSLPNSTTVGQYCHDYYYAFRQGTLGDPNFVIYVKLKFPNDVTFHKYLEEINVNGTPYAQIQDDQYFLIQGTKDLIAEYTNNQTYDGWFFDIEIVSINEQSKEISHIVAHAWDYWKDAKLFNALLLLKQK